MANSSTPTSFMVTQLWDLVPLPGGEWVTRTNPNLVILDIFLAKYAYLDLYTPTQCLQHMLCSLVISASVDYYYTAIISERQRHEGD